FEAIARELGQVFHQAVKVGLVTARKAETRQTIKTHTVGHETTNTANVGDWIVTNMTPGGKPLRNAKGQLDTYVIKAESFERLYDAAGRQSELGPLYSPRSTVAALELPGSFDIMAPWKERQRAASGYLIRNGDEVYGVEKSIFHRTYDLRGRGALKMLRP